MSDVVEKQNFDINKVNIKVYASKYDHEKEKLIKGILVNETKSNDDIEFHDLGIMIKQLENIYNRHHGTEISIHVEIKQLNHDDD